MNDVIKHYSLFAAEIDKAHWPKTQSRQREQWK